MNLLEHGLMLSVRVHEIACPRPDQDKEWDDEVRVTVAQQLHGGRGAAMGEVGAQLEAVGPALGGRECGFHRLNGGLDENGHW